MKQSQIILLVITLIVLCITTVSYIMTSSPTKSTKSLWQKEETLPYVEGTNKESIISQVYYEPTPDSIQVKVCLIHTIAKLTTIELLYKPSFEYTFNKIQDSICNRQLDVKIHSVGVHKHYFIKSQFTEDCEK